jgi:preprotein translocase subunit SecA
MYDAVENELTPNLMRALERQVMVRAIDSNWVQHLTSMENLRQGIGLHAYGQRDPLVMYKKEGHEMFQTLQARIQSDIAHTIFHVGVVPQGRRSDGRCNAVSDKTTVMSRVVGNRNREAVPVGDRKVGRNEQCPCGSGKKYKRCHGA